MTIPLNQFVNVTINLPPVGAPTPQFNLGLIIGTSTVISTGTRVVVYPNTDAMLTAGFSPSSAEYLAAQLYFASPAAPSQVAIGVQGNSETPLQAVQACRVANTNWYSCFVPGASDADHIAIATYIEGLSTPYSTYFLNTSESAVSANTSGNLFATMKADGYSRTLGQFSSNANAVASIMGYAMGATTTQPKSAYTLAFKSCPGVTPEPLNSDQFTNIAGNTGNNGNAYINVNNYYNWFTPGKVFSGNFFDEIIYTDMLVYAIDVAEANLLYQNRKVYGNEDGMTMLRSAVSVACEQLKTIGFIDDSGQSVWNGSNLLTLATGQALPNGYKVMSAPIASRSQSDANNRIASPIYLAMKTSGAIQDLAVQINVNR